MRAAFLGAAFLVAFLAPAGAGAQPPAGGPSVAQPAARAPVGAQIPTIDATVDPATATVGDRLHLTVRVEHAPGVELRFPDVAASIAPFQVLSEVVRPPEEGAGGRVVETRDYLVAAYKTGELWIPGIEVWGLTAAGDTVRAFSDSLLVTVASVIPDSLAEGKATPKDIKPPVDLPREWWPLAVLAAAALAAYFAYRSLSKWWRARKARPARPAEAPPVPREAAHEVAFARLRALEADDPLARGEIARFYDTLSDILRLYLGDRYAVKAIDMTTTELGPSMTAARMEPADVDWIARFLEHADLAKFAKLEPTLERARGDFRAAWDFVERTRFRGGSAPEGGAVGESMPEAAGGDVRPAEPSRDDGGSTSDAGGGKAC